MDFSIVIKDLSMVVSNEKICNGSVCFMSVMEKKIGIGYYPRRGPCSSIYCL